MKRDLRDLLADAERRGWHVDRTNSGHHRLRHASGAVVFAASTPSDWRELRNTQVRMRRIERQQQDRTHA